VLTYRQEDYIRTAVRAALAQTYPNLEILISDDASPDGTWDAILEEVDGYEGPHTVRIHRNPKNLGIGAHIREADSKLTGQLITHSAGDDWCEPDRVARMVEAWEANGSGSMLLFSNATIVDGDGKRRGAFYPRGMSEERLDARALVRSPPILGATVSFTKDLLTTLPRWPDAVIREDLILPPRAAMLGGVIYVPEALLCYRQHGENVWRGREAFASAGDYLTYQIRMLTADRLVFEQLVADADQARRLGGDPKACDAVADEARAQVERLDRVLAALTGRRRDRVRAIRRALARRDAARRLGGLLATAYVPWLLPLAQRMRRLRTSSP
jgi:glycosyltransferase involved in cell wall biosynthesis